jgi:hypothetical protein
MVSVQPVRIVGQLPRLRCEQGDLWATQSGITSHRNKCLIATAHTLRELHKGVILGQERRGVVSVDGEYS